MTRSRTGLNGWMRGLLVLCAMLLFAAPALPSVAQPLGDCCAGMSCHDVGKAQCPSTCMVACQAVVAPEGGIVESPSFGPTAVASPGAVLPPGRTTLPETPPPR